MTATLQDLYDKRASVWEAMKEIRDRADEDGDLSAEDEAAYTAAESELEKLSKNIERDEKAAKHEKVDRSRIPAPVAPDDDEPGAPPDRDKAYREAFEQYVVRGLADIEAELRKVLRNGYRPDKESRAQGVGTNTAGGYLVPQGFRQQIIEVMKDYGSVQSVAQVLNTDTGNTLPWPTNDDTGNVGALLAENTQVAEQDIVLGTNDLGAYKYTSRLVRVSLEFLQDVDWIDAEGFLRRKFGERLGRIHNQHFTTGTGTNQPQGIVTGATSGVTAASVTDIAVDELIDLQHSVDPAYRNDRSRFMFSDTALKVLRKKKDTTNQYIWQPTMQSGVPSMLLGSRYVINNDMAAPATGVKSVLYGDFFAGYAIRLVTAFELIRLNERYADFGQVGFVAFDRADGIVQDANAYKALTQA